MKHTAQPHSFQPYPEIAEKRRDPRPYRILDARELSGPGTSGRIDKVQRALVVPLEARARSVARHELAHARWSPQRLPEVEFDVRALQAVEDARINLGLAWQRVPVVLDLQDLAYVQWLGARDLLHGELAGFVLRAVAAVGTNATGQLLAAAAEGRAEARALAERWVRRAVRHLARARRRAGGPVAPFAASVRLARELARELTGLGLLRTDDSRAGAALFGRGCCLATPGAAGADGSGRGAGRGAAADGPPLPDGPQVQPGRMSLRSVPLEVPCPPRSGWGRGGWRPATEGCRIGWLHRWPSDGAIFRRRARGGGGTVLVDTSGSMSLDAAGVERLLSAAPSHTVVAIYSGRGDEGELRVVARGGRRACAEHLKRFGKGNVVDLPALRWLGRQPGPRLWISDGLVTGRGDRGSAAILDACHAVCRARGIRRVESAREAAELLSGPRPPEPRPPLRPARAVQLELGWDPGD